MKAYEQADRLDDIAKSEREMAHMASNQPMCGHIEPIEQAAQALRVLADAVKLLNDARTDPWCPWCSSVSGQGHTDDCPLAKALELLK